MTTFQPYTINYRNKLFGAITKVNAPQPTDRFTVHASAGNPAISQNRVNNYTDEKLEIISRDIELLRLLEADYSSSLQGNFAAFQLVIEKLTGSPENPELAIEVMKYTVLAVEAPRSANPNIADKEQGDDFANYLVRLAVKIEPVEYRAL